jgi:hypothetical protein
MDTIMAKFRSTITRICLNALIAIAAVSANPVNATDQFPSTFLVKSDGKWELWNGYLNGWSIIVKDKETGKSAEIPIDSVLSQSEFENYETTAGPVWGRYALAYFTRLDDRVVFRIRTRFFSDVLIDVEAGETLDATGLKRLLRDRDRSEIEKTLVDARSVMNSPRLDLSQAARVHAAIFHATEYKMHTVVEELQQLEDVEYIGAGVLPSGSFTKQPPIDVKSGFWHYTWYETRHLVSLALRRLGTTPKGYTSVAFVEADAKTLIDPLDRIKSIPQVTGGLAPAQVYQTLGTPDAIAPDYWRYDIDVENPYSVYVNWNDAGLVDSVLRQSPPTWHRDLNELLGP